MRTAIIGGGIAGLAAAFELEKARRAGAHVGYTLFEARERVGGCLASEIVDGAVLERGPDSFLSEKPAAAELCRELGLGAELLPSNDAERKTYILVRNRLVALPDGLMFMVPTKLIPTALTRLFSLRTKLRMGMELLHPPRPSGLADESVAALVERHFGAEAVDAAGRSAAERDFWRGCGATERADGAAAAGGDGERVRLADSRNAGGAPQDARQGQGWKEWGRVWRWIRRGERTAGGAGYFYGAAGRDAAVDRCAEGADRSGPGALFDAGDWAGDGAGRAGR